MSTGHVADDTIQEIIRRADSLDHAPFAVGIAILPFRLVGMITDLNGTNLGVGRWDLVHMDVDNVVQRAAALARHLVLSSVGLKLPNPRVRIGLQLGGPVDPITGMVRFYCNPLDAGTAYRWENVPLADLMQEATGCPTVIDNDAHALAAYELKLGIDAASFVLIYLNDGVGAGVVLDRKVLSAPIEFGHLQVRENGRRCECGNVGCIDAHAGRRAIRAVVAELTGRAAIDSIERAVEIANHGDIEAANALSAFTQAGQSLARGLATMLTIFGPTDLVLYGPDVLIDEDRSSPAAEHFMREVRKFSDYTHPVLRKCRLLCRPLPPQPDPNSGAHGAALIALHRHFYAPLGSRLEYSL